MRNLTKRMRTFCLCEDLFPVLRRFDLGYTAILTCRFAWCENWVVLGVIEIFKLDCVRVCVSAGGGRAAAIVSSVS